MTGTGADDGEEDISMMVLPDYSSGNNERDIHVKNFNINVGGLELLDCADLKLAYGRKVHSARKKRQYYPRTPMIVSSIRSVLEYNSLLVCILSAFMGFCCFLPSLLCS